MKMVSMETVYKFDIVAKNAVQNAFDHAGLVLALREATAVINTLSEELRETRQEYKNNIAKTEQILLGLTEYRKQNKNEREKITRDVVDYWLEKVSSPKQSVTNKIIVYFSADNELYCEPKNEHHYRLEANSGRSKLINTLITHRGYMPTQTLIEITGLRNQKSIESTVYEMKKIIHKKLNISNFIDGYQDSGYRISPDVILKKD